MLDFLLLFLVATAVLGLFLLVRRLRPGDRAYRTGVAFGLLAALLLFWVNGAVGIIGALAARLRPRGMAWAMTATAAAQLSVAIVALVGGLGAEAAAWPADVIAATLLFTGLWAVSAMRFRTAARAAQEEAERVAPD